MSENYPRIPGFRSAAAFAEYIGNLARDHFQLDLVVDDRPLSQAEGSPLAEPMEVGNWRIGNRWCIQPMEGWDGTTDGKPTDRTIRRWEHFGLSGAKLIWGGEAVAVRHEARANPHQLCYRPENLDGFRVLLRTLRDAHRKRFGPAALDDLTIGLQLTHSGRFCCPNQKGKLEPRIIYHHPVLDAKFGLNPADDSPVLTDEELAGLVDDFVAAAKMAETVGFDFVDVKACHGYLGHESLSAFDRPGPYGGAFENRIRWLCSIIEGIQASCPRLKIGVRLSLFDFPPFRPDPEKTGGGKLGPGIPHDYPVPYPGFGCDRMNPQKIDLSEPLAFVRHLYERYGIRLFNFTAGSPYYNPHIQRPALYPPCDGYQPPEDPTLGCLRQIAAMRQVKQALPQIVAVGSAYTYFQEFLPHVAQAVVRRGWTDFVGLGRMVLSYWELPADVLAGQPLQTKRICRTFSDCTNAPRNGLPSGCYPLDPHYKSSMEAGLLKQIKQEIRIRLGGRDEPEPQEE